MTILLKILLKFFLKVPKIIFVTVATLFIAPFIWALFSFFILLFIEVFCRFLGWQMPGPVVSNIIAWAVLVLAVMGTVLSILEWMEKPGEERELRKAALAELKKHQEKG